MTAIGWRKRQIMQWIPNDENKRRDEAFADFIGGVAYEEDRGWSKEVWDAAWSARRDEAVAEKQEPVCVAFIRQLVSIDKDGIETWKNEPLYISPPKREWVGLTEEEMRQAANEMDAEPLAEGWKELIKFGRAIEAKLRESNGTRAWFTVDEFNEWAEKLIEKEKNDG